jgi:hypothetical protein
MHSGTTRTLAVAAFLAISVTLGGCIVSDQLTTITIHPDGSADVLRVQSNVHSSESGDKAAEELRNYVDQFNGQKDTDQAGIKEAGGEVKESRWIRKEAPHANLVVARLPTAASLEKAFTIKGDNGETVVTARFTKDGMRRKLSLLVRLPLEQVANSPTEQSIKELRARQANGLSETRIAVTGGKITDARGFTVAEDKQSALLEPTAILDLLRTQRKAEAFIEWEVGG